MIIVKRFYFVKNYIQHISVRRPFVLRFRDNLPLQEYLFFFFLIFCFLFQESAAFAQKSSSFKSSQRVRIAILKNIDQVFIEIRGQYHMIDPATQQVLYEDWGLRKTKIVASSWGLKFGKDYLKQERIRIIPRREISIYILGKKRKYRGFIDIIRKKDKKLIVINQLDLEDYIKGVLYHEVSHRWPMEALKAQAVAARTYAVYRMKVNADKDFDVTSDIYSQVYGGRTSERYRTNLAVNRTKRQVMTYQGDIIPAYFHATCGGQTEDVSELWKHPNAPYLKGGKCPFCSFSPHYHWKKNLQLKDIQNKLNEKGLKVGLIKNIRIVSYNKSGRIQKLKITARDGKTQDITGKDFRLFIGPNIIKSNHYQIEMNGYYMDIIGRGWGHGVGMCQWGALGMARQRFYYKEILHFYYPDVQITTYRPKKKENEQ